MQSASSSATAANGQRQSKRFIDPAKYRQSCEYLLLNFDLRDVSDRQKARSASSLLETFARAGIITRYYGSINYELISTFTRELGEKVNPPAVRVTLAFFHSAQLIIALCRNVQALPGSYMFRSLLFAHLQRIITLKPELNESRHEFLRMAAAKRQKDITLALQRRDGGHMDHLRERDFHGHEKALLGRYCGITPTLSEDKTEVLVIRTNIDHSCQTKEAEDDIERSTSRREELASKDAAKNAKLGTRSTLAKGKRSSQKPAKDPFERSVASQGRNPLWEPSLFQNPNRVMFPMDAMSAYAEAGNMLAELGIAKRAAAKGKQKKQF